MIKKRLGTALLGLWGSLLGLAVEQGAAQETDGATALLEEIVVTARRRAENLQEVPISVVNLSTEDLEFRGIDQVEDLSAMVPNVSLIGGGATGTVGDAQFLMRGIPGVATFIDGVWQANNDGILTRNLVEVERIEVLRGPQGTLFGKNTTGGAIQIFTARPAEEFGARISATTGSYSRRDVNVAIDLPITESFRTKWTGASLNRDGYVRSLTTGRDFGDMNNQVLRGDLLWTPTDNLDVRVIYETNERQENGDPRVLSEFLEDGTVVNQFIARNQQFRVGCNRNGVPCTPADEFALSNLTHAARWPGGQVGEFETKTDITVDGNMVDAQSASIDVNLNISESLAFRSISAYREQRLRVYTDFDASEVTLIEDDRHRKQRQFTQEFQLNGEGGERFDWVIGAYYWDEMDEQRRFRWTWDEFRTGQPVFPWFGPGTAPTFSFAQVQAACVGAAAAGLGGCTLGPPPTDEYIGTETDGWALFGEVDVLLTDQLTLTVGYRKQEEDLEQYTRIGNPAQFSPRPNSDPVGDIFNGPKNVRAPAEFDSDTGRLALTYRINDDVMVYGSYSEGFSRGGVSTAFPAGNLIVVPFDPEELENVEVGLRSDWLDGRLRLNLTLFDSDWAGIQVAETVPDPTCAGQPGCPNLPNLVTKNAAAATVDGTELEFIVLPSEHWRFDLNVGALNTEYTDTGGTADIQPGDTFQQAPDLTYSLGIQWDGQGTNGGEFTARLSYAWTDDYVRSREALRQFREQDSFALVNTRVSYTPPLGNWRLSLFGTNLTDEYYLNSGFLSTGTTQDFATVGRPREAGVELQFYFD